MSEVIDPEDRELDWVSGHDPRSKNFAFSAAPVKPLPRKAKFWKPGPIMDQGREGACVGFGFAGEVAATPMPYYEKTPGECTKFAQWVYKEAQAHDRKLGWNFPEGASVLGGAKTLKARGHFDDYYWCLSPEQVLAALMHGTVIAGIPWYEGMYETRPSGLIEVTGRKVGGHCIYLLGQHPSMRLKEEGWHKRFDVVAFVNSWGLRYGKGGIGYIKVEDLARLLKGQGEACVPMGRKPVLKL